MKLRERLERVASKIGPGFITGAADNDPSGIATYTMVGAQFGLGQLWTSGITLPFMIAVQEMSARIAMAAGEGITAVLKRHYARWIVLVFTALLLAANIFNIGADLGAMADAAKLLLPSIPFALWAIFFAVLIVVLEIILTYRVYARVLKWLTLSLLSYIAVAAIVTTEWRPVLQSLLTPHIILSHDGLAALVAIIGTTISPYLFLWQSEEEVEEEIAHGRGTIKKRRGISHAELTEMREDTVIGMTFSQLITFFIMTTAVMTFFRHGITVIHSTSEAARALEPLAGAYAEMLFAIGIIGTGLLAVPVLSASASYAIAEVFGWKHHSLSEPFQRAHAFYAAIIVSTFLGLLLNAFGLDPLRALFWTAIANGVASPLIILMMMAAANNPKIMGSCTNSTTSNILCGFTAIGTAVAAIALFVV